MQGTEVTGRRGRRRKQLLDDLREKRNYWKVKEEALDRMLWRSRVESDYVTIIRQTMCIELIFLACLSSFSKKRRRLLNHIYRNFHVSQLKQNEYFAIASGHPTWHPSVFLIKFCWFCQFVKLQTIILSGRRIVSYERMVKDIKGSDCGLTESNLPKLSWRYWEKQRKPQYIPCIWKDPNLVLPKCRQEAWRLETDCSVIFTVNMMWVMWYFRWIYLLCSHNYIR